MCTALGRIVREEYMIKLTVDTFKKRFPQFGSALSPDEITALISLLKIQIVEASEALIVEGTETDALFFVWEGQLDVLMSSSYGEYKVASVEQGALLGEISLLSPGKTTATVRSELGCIALHLDTSSLERFWETNPHAASVFLGEINRLLAQRIRSVNATVKTLQESPNPDTDRLKTEQHNLVKG